MRTLFAFIRKLLPPYSPETIATGFVGFFFIIGLVATLSFVAQTAVKQAATPGSSQALTILGSLVAACFGVALTIVIAPSLGRLCSLPLMHRTVKEGLSAELVKKEFGLADDEMLMGFIRQQKVKVYRAKNRLPGTVSYDISALLEPLFPLWVYFPLLPSRFIGANRICFDREEIEPIKKRTLDSLLAAMPEVIQSVVAEKDSLISSLQTRLHEIEETHESERQEFESILQSQLQALKESGENERKALETSLQMQLQDLKEAGDKERRDLRKLLALSEKRVIEYLLLGFVGMRLVSQFHERRYGGNSVSRFQVTKAVINEELDSLRHNEPLLDNQLARWQRSSKKEQDDEFYDFLRLAMPDELVNWGGYAMTFDAAVKKYLKSDSSSVATIAGTSG
ncbi:hypothetical protein [Desulfovibrio falkowii]|uniref:hypothetical protein n=1 Tax=Desulfovibrio sp. WGS1351 TaxID=3366814 RepID=UPI00372D4456